MQPAFIDNWTASLGTVLYGDDYFPAIQPAGPQVAQVFKSSASEASESVRFMYLLSIACATRHIRIANAYFVPDQLSVETLVAAAQRGVRVEIIVPGSKTDALVVRRASRSRWGPLLSAGIAMTVARRASCVAWTYRFSTAPSTTPAISDRGCACH